MNGQPENGNETSLKKSSPDEMPCKKQKQWVKKDSKKRQLEMTDVQLTKVMKSLNESIARTDDPKRMDEN